MSTAYAFTPDQFIWIARDAVETKLTRLVQTINAHGNLERAFADVQRELHDLSVGLDTMADFAASVAGGWQEPADFEAARVEAPPAAAAEPAAPECVNPRPDSDISGSVTAPQQPE